LAFLCLPDSIAAGAAGDPGEHAAKPEFGVLGAAALCRDRGPCGSVLTDLTRTGSHAQARLRRGGVGCGRRIHVDLDPLYQH